MSRLKNIIESKIKRLLEVDISDLPQKQVVKDRTVQKQGVTSATIDNIVSKFREIGIDVDTNALATVELLKSKSPFNISFKLKTPTEFFDGNTDISDKAKVNVKKSINGNLVLDFMSDDVTIEFNPKDLKDMRPQTGEKMTIIQENVKYRVKIYNTEELVDEDQVRIVIPGQGYITVNKNQVGKLFKYTAKSGNSYVVSPNPKKQSGVREGFINVTIVEGPSTNKSYVIPKTLLSPLGNDNLVYFNNDGKTQIVSQGMDNVIMIKSLPNFNQDDEDKSGQNIRFSKNKPIPTEITLRVEHPSKLNALKLGTLGSLNGKLKNSKSSWSLSSQNEVLKVELEDGTVVMLKPQNLYPDPQFLGNWRNLYVQIGRLAGNDENWDEDIMGTATIKLRK